MIALLRTLVGLALVCLIPGQASAHLLSAGVGSIQIQGETSTLLIAVPVSLFRGVDLDGDGLLQPEEIRQGRLVMIQQLESAIKLRLGQEPGSAIDDQLIVSVQLDRRNSTNQIEWRRLIRFPREALVQPVHLSIAPIALSTSYMVQVNRFDETEAVVLSSEYPAHTFLKGAWGTFHAFLEQGVLHILKGYDHVLFLLTLLCAVVALRRWLVLLTAFTLAHGTTYGLVTFGVLHVSPELIEPVIALSIVLASGTYLMGWRPALSVESAAVFSLGLFHGLGFASSMAVLFHEQRFPLASVLGFNAGVEIGQVAIAVGLGTLVVLLTRIHPTLRDNTVLARGVSWVAVVLGAYWFVDRVWV